MTRDDVIRMAREAGFDRSNPHCDLMVIHSNGSWIGIEKELTRFAGLAIADFLARTGQYVTNDASREAALEQARAEEREKCVAICKANAEKWRARNARWQHHQGAAIGADVCADDIAKLGQACST